MTGWRGSRYYGTFVDFETSINAKRGSRREQAEDIVKHARNLLSQAEDELKNARAEEKSRPS